MIKNMKITLSILFIGLVFYSKGFCQENKERDISPDSTSVIEISYQITGDDIGKILKLTITKDSIKYYDCGNIQPNGNVLEKSKSIVIKTDFKFWNLLVNSINLSNFDNVHSGPATAYIDGIDRIICIKTTKRMHYIIMDPEIKKNIYNKITNLINLMNNCLKQFDNKQEIHTYPYY